MPLSYSLRRLVPAALLGITASATGCSAEPDAEPLPAEPAAVEAPAQGASIADSQPAPSAAATLQPASEPRLAVEAEGLRWFLQPSGSARPIPFGRPEPEVLASLERVRGPAEIGTNQDCGAGPVKVARWSDGLNLIFQNDRFVGWGLGRRASGEIATAANIAPGSTRSELDEAYSATVSQTSLGSEFSAGGLHGVLDGASAGARITDMWAGVSCVAR